MVIKDHYHKVQFIDTVRVVCKAGSRKRSGVRPSVCLSVCPTNRQQQRRAPGIAVNSYWAQGLKPPPHFYDHGARIYDEPPTFVT